MKTKSIMRIFSFALAGLLLLNSCSDVLDVRNEGQLSTEAALSDARSVNVAMSGIYSSLQGSLGSGIPASPSEALAGDIVYAGSDYGYLEIWTQNMSLFTPSFSGFWDNSYRGINAVNNVLASLPDIKDMTDAQKSQIEGECKFIRGVMIFEMLRIWGHQYGHKPDNSQPGVIIRTAPTRGTAGLAIGRSTVEDCYAQVISDLKAGENLLSDAKRDGYANKSAAQAYLARVYFQKNDFANAYAYADLIKKGGKFSLAATPLDVFFKGGNSESIFQMALTTQTNSFGAIRGMYQKTAFGEPPFTVSPDFAAALDASPSTDLRKQQYVKQSGSTRYCTKYDTLIANVNVIRYAEIIFIHAEAGLELGKPESEVLADVNLIRKRAGLADDNSTTGKAALLDLIGKERRLEMCFEGDRFHYL
ncbi:MAG: RagB/SusD family nutrient uptake outer membrane protein, partial [Ignavibacteria bacterium]